MTYYKTSLLLIFWAFACHGRIAKLHVQQTTHAFCEEGHIARNERDSSVEQNGLNPNKGKSHICNSMAALAMLLLVLNPSVGWRILCAHHDRSCAMKTSPKVKGSTAGSGECAQSVNKLAGMQSVRGISWPWMSLHRRDISMQAGAEARQVHEFYLRSKGPPEVTDILERALLEQWRPSRDPDSIGISGFYVYTAAMRPRAARELLRLLPRGTLLDPFCGSGCSLLEGLVSGRCVIGNDASPFALFVSLHQTLRPSEEDLQTIRTVARDVVCNARDSARNKTSRDPIWHALGKAVRRAEAAEPLLSTHTENTFGQLPTPLWFCLGAAMQRAPDQQLRPYDLYCKTVDDYCMALSQLTHMTLADLPPPTLLHADARSINCSSLPNCTAVDAILTSPPYPGVYDYLALAREERARLSFQVKRGHRRKTRGLQLGGGAGDEAEGPALMGLAALPNRDWPAGWTSDNEMGARKAMRRHKHFANFTADWQADQLAWLRSARNCLRSGGLAAVIIGDGNTVDSLASTVDAATSVGFVVEGTATISPSADVSLRRPGTYSAEHAILLRAP